LIKTLPEPSMTSMVTPEAEDPSENPPSQSTVPSPLSKQEHKGVCAKAEPAISSTPQAKITGIKNRFMVSPSYFFK
jgi:hypothetical protein